MSGDRPHFYDFGSFRVDPAQRVLLRDGRPVALQPKAFEILLFLVRNPGRLITKEELLSAIWPELVVEESNLSQNIFLLRKALGDGESGHRCIVTLPRRGYQFAEAVHVRQNGVATTVGSSGTPLPPGVDATLSAEPRTSRIPWRPRGDRYRRVGRLRQQHWRPGLRRHASSGSCGTTGTIAVSESTVRSADQPNADADGKAKGNADQQRVGSRSLPAQWQCGHDRRRYCEARNSISADAESLRLHGRRNAGSRAIAGQRQEPRSRCTGQRSRRSTHQAWRVFELGTEI